MGSPETCGGCGRKARRIGMSGDGPRCLRCAMYGDALPTPPAPADVATDGPNSPGAVYDACRRATAPADDARPMVTGGGLIKFDRRADDASGAEAMREAFVAHMASLGTTGVVWTPNLGPVGYRNDRHSAFLAVEWERFAAGYRAALPARADAVEEAAGRVAADAVVRALDAVGVRPCNADDFDEIVASSVAAALRRAHGGPPERSDGGQGAAGDQGGA